MMTKWLLQNKVLMSACTSSAGMTALAVVLAAPGKWNR